MKARTRTEGKKGSSGQPRKSWLEPVAGATEKDYRRLEMRVFNATELPPNATLLDLKLTRQARQGGSKNQMTIASDDTLARSKTVWPKFAGTEFEPLLRRIVIPGVVDASTEPWWTRFWEYIYGEIIGIGQDFKREPTERNEQARRTAQKYGMAEPQTRETISLSKQSTRTCGIARRLECLSTDVEPLSPMLAQKLKYASETFAAESAEMSKLARSVKRHSQHPETGRILELMEFVHSETGQWHDPEISALLKLAGLSQYPPERLRQLRSRTKVKNHASN
jgi:hypothetical protein